MSKDTRTPQDIALEGMNWEAKSKALEIAKRAGIDESEPMWWIFVALGSLEGVAANSDRSMQDAMGLLDGAAAQLHAINEQQGKITKAMESVEASQAKVSASQKVVSLSFWSQVSILGASALIASMGWFLFGYYYGKSQAIANVGGESLYQYSSALWQIKDNPDRLLKCRQDANEKCTFWLK